MTKRRYSSAERASAVELSASLGPRAASRELGIPCATVAHWAQQAKTEYQAPVVQDENEAAQFELASLRAELGRMKKRDLDDPEALWSRMEDENEHRITKSKEQRNATLDLRENKPVGVCFMGDLHISAGEVDLKRMRKDAELAAETEGLHLVLMGDAVNASITHRMSMILSQSTPSQELKMFNFLLNIFSHRVAAIIAGNHCSTRFMKWAGIDPIADICERRGISYMPDELHLNLNLPGWSYHIAARHQYARFNSSMNMSHSVKQWYNFGNSTFDCGAIAHNHDPCVETAIRHGQPIVLVRNGSYQISSGYSRDLGFQDSQPFSPVVIFFPGERKMMQFLDIRDGARVLTALRA